MKKYPYTSKDKNANIWQRKSAQMLNMKWILNSAPKSDFIDLQDGIFGALCTNKNTR
jgi:hypothetical protein